VNAASPANPIAAKAHPKNVVLVIARQAAVRRLICRNLSAEGFRCFEADSAAEALEVLWLVAPGRIDLVIAEADMPDLEAPRLVAASRERWPDQCVLFLVGGPSQLKAEDLPQRGAYVLEKPFTRVQLLRAVSAALDRRKVPRK
jgi:DNA-binding NtrC family response regulator